MPVVPDGGGRGGGGGSLNPTLIISPTSPYGLGGVPSTLPTNFVVTLKNGGGASSGSITISAINFSDPQWTCTDALPITFSSTFTLHLRLTPTSVGAKTVTITFNNSTSKPQVQYVVTATAIDPATQGIPKVISGDPTLPVGQAQTTKANTTSAFSVGIKNVGAFAFNVTGATISVGGTWFVLTPAVGLPVTLNPNDTVFFPINFTPNDIGVFNGTLHFTTNLVAPYNAFDVPLAGLSVPFIPVSILDNANRAVMFAFQGGALKFIDTNVYDYQDDDSVLVFNGSLWDSLGQEKTIERIEVFYENIGVCQQLVCTLTILRPSIGADSFDVVTKIITIGTVTADNTDRSQFIDLTGSGELIFLSITRPKAQGPCALTAIVPHFADRGEKVENV